MVKTGAGCGKVKGNFMKFRQHCQVVSPDLVSRIQIPDDPVCPGDYAVDHLFLHQKSCHIIADKHSIDPLLEKLPGGQSCSLKNRTGLIHVNLYLFSLC